MVHAIASTSHAVKVTGSIPMAGTKKFATMAQIVPPWIKFILFLKYLLDRNKKKKLKLYHRKKSVKFYPKKEYPNIKKTVS